MEHEKPGYLDIAEEQYPPPPTKRELKAFYDKMICPLKEGTLPNLHTKRLGTAFKEEYPALIKRSRDIINKKARIPSKIKALKPLDAPTHDEANIYAVFTFILKSFYQTYRKPWTAMLYKQQHDKKGSRRVKITFDILNGAVLFININNFVFHIVENLLNHLHLLRFLPALFILQIATETLVVAHKLTKIWTSDHLSKTQKFTASLKVGIPYGLITSALVGVAIQGVTFVAAPFLFTAGLGCIGFLTAVKCIKSIKAYRDTPRELRFNEQRLRIASQAIKACMFTGLTALLPVFFFALPALSFIPGLNIGVGVAMVAVSSGILCWKLIKHRIQRPMQKQAQNHASAITNHSQEGENLHPCAKALNLLVKDFDSNHAESCQNDNPKIPSPPQDSQYESFNRISCSVEPESNPPMTNLFKFFLGKQNEQLNQPSELGISSEYQAPQ